MIESCPGWAQRLLSRCRVILMGGLTLALTLTLLSRHPPPPHPHPHPRPRPRPRPHPNRWRADHNLWAVPAGGVQLCTELPEMLSVERIVSVKPGKGRQRAVRRHSTAATSCSHRREQQHASSDGAFATTCHDDAAGGHAAGGGAAMQQGLSSTGHGAGGDAAGGGAPMGDLGAAVGVGKLVTGTAGAASTAPVAATPPPPRQSSLVLIKWRGLDYSFLTWATGSRPQSHLSALAPTTPVGSRPQPHLSALPLGSPLLICSAHPEVLGPRPATAGGRRGPRRVDCGEPLTHGVAATRSSGHRRPPRPTPSSVCRR